MTALAALAAVYGAGLLYEADFAPAGCCGLSLPNPDPMQAERLLAQSDPKGTSVNAQRKAALALLAARPGDVGGWLRLAYADRLEHGRLTEAGVHDLEMSYLVDPFAYRQSPWRLAFALDNWGGLSPEARKDALKEIELVKRSPEIQDDARQAVRAIHNPSGRMTAALMGLS